MANLYSIKSGDEELATVVGNGWENASSDDLKKYLLSDYANWIYDHCDSDFKFEMKKKYLLEVEKYKNFKAERVIYAVLR